MSDSTAPAANTDKQVTLNDLRSLALLLPPNEKIAASEVADVASGIAAAMNYGPKLLEAAAKNGAQGVHDFFHNVQADIAEKLGAPAPVKGAPVVNVQTNQAPTGSSATSGDLVALKADILGDVRSLLTEFLGAAKEPAEVPADTTAPDSNAASDPPADDGTGA